MFGFCGSTNSNGASVEEIMAEGCDHTHGIRTQADDPVSAAAALKKLQEGNARYVAGTPLHCNIDNTARNALAQHGQLPLAAVIGCADSRCPIELLFDVQPGDVFVLRNAGNTCTHAEGSVVGSIEYCVSALHTQLVLVLGHTMCGAIKGATQIALTPREPPSGKMLERRRSSLEGLLDGLSPVAKQASGELGHNATVDEVAAKAVKVNVFHTIHKLISYSKIIKEKISKGEVQVQGAIYDIVSGKVEFLGKSAQEALFLDLDASFEFEYEAKSTNPGSDTSNDESPSGESSHNDQESRGRAASSASSSPSPKRKETGAKQTVKN